MDEKKGICDYKKQNQLKGQNNFKIFVQKTFDKWRKIGYYIYGVCQNEDNYILTAPIRMC